MVSYTSLTGCEVFKIGILVVVSVSASTGKVSMFEISCVLTFRTGMTFKLNRTFRIVRTFSVSRTFRIFGTVGMFRTLRMFGTVSMFRTLGIFRS